MNITFSESDNKKVEASTCIKVPISKYWYELCSLLYSNSCFAGYKVNLKLSEM